MILFNFHKEPVERRLNSTKTKKKEKKKKKNCRIMADNRRALEKLVGEQASLEAELAALEKKDKKGKRTEGKPILLLALLLSLSPLLSPQTIQSSSLSLNIAFCLQSCAASLLTCAPQSP